VEGEVEDDYIYDDDWASEDSLPEPEDDDDSDYMEGSAKKKKKTSRVKSNQREISKRSRGRTPGKLP
jgi:hypothetical protein